MKICIGQINTTPRDFAGNVAQITAGIDYAENQKADLVVFPELSIPGYLVKDCVYAEGFVETNLQWLRSILEHSKEMNVEIVVGYVARNNSGVGKPFRNVVAIIRHGVVIAEYTKQLLPFYDVFDEARYFEPGKEATVITVKDQKFGLLICEDGWNDKGSDEYNYRNNPYTQYRELGINNFIWVNSSPYISHKPLRRRNMMLESAKDGLLIYVNQIGGQDELVFDGHSVVVNNGGVVFQAPTCKDANYYIVETEGTGHQIVHDDPMADTYEMLVMGIRDYVKKSGFKDIVLGSSGGIDSAVVAALACEALGSTNVHCIRMPTEYSSNHSMTDAQELHHNLGCWDYVVPINAHTMRAEIVYNINNSGQRLFYKDGINAYDEITFEDKPYNRVADENIQARLRGATLMHFSNAYGQLLLTTGNKSEIATGYCTLYGDTNGGYAPISDFYKTEVFAIAKYINRNRIVIPQNIIVKPPSAELAPDQTDEKNLGLYPILDSIIYQYVEKFVGNFNSFRQLRCWYPRTGVVFDANFSDIVMRVQYDDMVAMWLITDGAQQHYERIIKLIDRNEYKRRQLAPGIKRSAVAFGSGRRFPIVKA